MAINWTRQNKLLAAGAAGLFLFGVMIGGAGDSPTPSPVTKTSTRTVTATTTVSAAPTATVTVTETAAVPTQAAPPAAAAAPGNNSAYYANCTEARAAGAAPIRRGEPGYRSGLDRDNDGIACE